jgi:PPOX class probable F420-dependent enzyme
MDEAEARRRLAGARVGHLATVGADGRPSVVPLCFAVEGDVLWTAVDGKPKRTTRLARLADIAAHPEVAVVVDHWSEDWNRLWWVRVRGLARVVDDEAERATGLGLLTAKYEQYRAQVPEGPVVAVRLLEWRAWSAAGDGREPS